MTAGAAAAVAARAGPSHRCRRAGYAPLGRWPAVLAGSGWRGAGRGPPGGVRTAATVVGLGLAVVAIVATVTFQASLQRLVDTPGRYGLTSDLTVVDAREPDVAELVADRRVAALDVVTTVPVTFGDDAGPCSCCRWSTARARCRSRPSPAGPPLASVRSRCGRARRTGSEWAWATPCRCGRSRGRRFRCG